MIVYGMAKVMLSVGGRNIESEILITPDLNGLIVGIDWLAKRGEFVWDFRNQQIKFADSKWMNLHEKVQDEVNIRRICVEEDVILPRHSRPKYRYELVIIREGINLSSE